MRYFRIFDDLSGEDGDLYRWDGDSLRMKLANGDYGHSDSPASHETIEQYITWLAGRRGRWVEEDGSDV